MARDNMGMLALLGIGAFVLLNSNSASAAGSQDQSGGTSDGTDTGGGTIAPDMSGGGMAIGDTSVIPQNSGGAAINPGSTNQQGMTYDLVTGAYGDTNAPGGQLRTAQIATPMLHADPATLPLSVEFPGLQAQPGPAAAIAALAAMTTQPGQLPRDFNPWVYLASNPALIPVVGDDPNAMTQHYLQTGQAAGLSYNSFDPIDYVAANPDLIHMWGTNFTPDEAAQDYVHDGYAEGRPTMFDGMEYLASNPDLITQIGVDPEKAAWHYITTGYIQKRPTNTFDPNAYASAHPELGAAGIVTPAALELHYVLSLQSGGAPFMPGATNAAAQSTALAPAAAMRTVIAQETGRSVADILSSDSPTAGRGVRLQMQ